MAAAANLIHNPDFKSVNGSSPAGWSAWGHPNTSKILVPKDVKFKGKNCCLCNNRKESWNGIAQNVTRILQSGHVYKFSAHVKLSSKTPKGTKHAIWVTMMYKVSNTPYMNFLRIAELPGVSADKWVQVCGNLNMPHIPQDVALLEAQIYFEGPPPGINIMCAEVALVDENPSADDEPKTAVGANLLINSDFQQVSGQSPMGWHGFDHGNISVPNDVKFNGKNCCLCDKRTKLWQGIAQHVVRVVKTGHVYNVSAHVRLGANTPKEKSHGVWATMWYKLSSMSEPTWHRIVECPGITLERWHQIFGSLNVPYVSDDVVLLEAQIYFEGPPPGTDFMCAQVSLTEDTTGVDNGRKNLLINPHFQQVNGKSPMGWHGFGGTDCHIVVPSDVKFNGENCCLISNRKQHYYGLAQHIVRFVESDHVYRISAHVRMGKEAKKGKHYKINITVMYRLSNMSDNGFFRVTDVSCVTSDKWQPVIGCINIPHMPSDVAMLQVEVYFEGPPAGVTFMVAEVFLTDITGLAEVQHSLSSIKLEDKPGIPKNSTKSTAGIPLAPTQHAMPSIATIKLPAQCSDAQTSAKQVFISYQWGIQDWVKELKSKLEQNGITCWMDIGQMGGGDALFAEIDAGMRAAKVVLACVTHAYSVSENCQREVTLADILKKPVIPLLFDKSIGWPPPGQMSLIFAKLLYIDMTGKPGTIPNKKFDELVGRVKNRLDNY